MGPVTSPRLLGCLIGQVSQIQVEVLKLDTSTIRRNYCCLCILYTSNNSSKICYETWYIIRKCSITASGHHVILRNQEYWLIFGRCRCGIHQPSLMRLWYVNMCERSRPILTMISERLRKRLTRKDRIDKHPTVNEKTTALRCAHHCRWLFSM